ncbi:hypothetical protein [Flavobacterium sp. HSC-61S13]|uniref:hypothetical protein n=1 Tax=Flavobacterium sp. HSC-61S13 TaxID=2910963 RepID=UPI0020A1AC84|nr:hypothetical protein [Flavobacterium sp. HSC-61S13]MCP1996641.1 hypothetical protein [Flavobacterium sp. HSC-61S13]
MSGEKLTHSEIIEIGYKWLFSKCSFAVKDLVTHNQETPDIIGWNAEGSFLLEAKVSRSDFLADKKKPFRLNPETGMGDWRFFIAPKGLIRVEELPDMWGLIEVNEKRKATMVHNPFGKGNIYCTWHKHEKCNGSEVIIMKSVLRRLHQKGLINEIYKK